MRKTSAFVACCLPTVLLVLMLFALQLGSSPQTQAGLRPRAMQVSSQDLRHLTSAEQSLSASALAIGQLDYPDPVPATWYIRYTIVVTNTGNTLLGHILISNPVPAGTYFVEADRGGLCEAGIITWIVSSLDPGAAASVHLTLGTFSTTRGPITNTVTAALENGVAASSTEITSVIPPPTPTWTASPTLSESARSTATEAAAQTATITPPATASPSPTATPSPSHTATPSPSPSRMASAQATSTQPRPTSTTVAPSPTAPLDPGARSPASIPPVIFVMLDWMNGDWANPDYSCTFVNAYGQWLEVQGNPSYGPLGGWAEFYWNELNPGPGVYNWTKIDQYIKKAQTMRVTLPDATVVAKPVGISVATWTSDHTATTIGVNRTPSWVALDAGSITSCYDPDGAWGSCKRFCTPAFSNPTWQYWFDQFVLAMGRHYDNNSEFYNLAFVNIATGVDGETSERKDFAPCSYFFGNSQAFNDWVEHVMLTYSQAFPHTVQFIQSTVHSIHGNAAYAASLSSGMTGVKVNGLEVDVANAEVRRDGVLVGGITGFSSVWHPLIPTGFEPKHGNGIEGSYWFFMEGLSVHPYVFDVQYQNIRDTYLAEQRTGFPILDFVRRHLGKTVENTPDVWIVLRETQHYDVYWQGSDGVLNQYGPHHGDFQYWLYRRDDYPNSRTVALFSSRAPRELPTEARSHPYGWHTMRRTDEATDNPYMSFNIDDRYPYAGQMPQAAGGTTSWSITATFVNRGVDSLSLEYRDYAGNLVSHRINKGTALGAANTWVDYTWHVNDAYLNNNLPGGADFRLNSNGDGDEIVHRLIVKGQPLSCTRSSPTP